MFANFIIPSLGRKTLANTLWHISKQTDPDWSITLIFDNVEPTVEDDDIYSKLQCLETSRKLGVGVNGAGAVRNYGINNCVFKPKWFIMMDDDDVPSQFYVERLKEVAKLQPQADIICFSMIYADGTVLPKNTSDPIEKLENQIGISFACKPRVFEKVQFEPSSGEDYQFLLKAKNNGFNIYINNYVNYFVAPLGIAEDRRKK